jgi:hypothetical protein
MQIHVDTAPTADNRRFKAKVGEPYALAVEAKDRDTAFAAMIELMRSRAPGAEIVRNDWPTYSPWFEFCGSSDPNDPREQEFVEILHENRRRMNEEDGIVTPDDGEAA